MNESFNQDWVDTKPGSLLFIVTLAAATYLVLGWFGISLTIPPGYASPLFPAAGFAVAVMLWSGNRAWPGILLGSVLLNLGIAWQHGDLGYLSVISACGIACGSALQAYVAARLAVQKLLDEKKLAENPLTDSVGAVSVGIFGGRELLDLAYVEDKDAEVDFNIVMTGRGQFVEVQGSGEEATFSQAQLDSLLGLAQKGLKEVSSLQTLFLTRKLLGS